MQQATQADADLTMKLLEEALARPAAERQSYLRAACRGDSALLQQVCGYLQRQERMGDFLLEPFLPPPVEDRPLEPDQLLIGRFRILREVARGGMGIVWEALDEKLDRRVAIKVAKHGFAAQLPPEVRHARDVSHPNVCKIFEIHTADTPRGPIDFITMEFVEGETLSERLQRGPISEKEHLNIARQLCAGVSEAHRNNIVHGDLKSNNIILSSWPDGSVRPVIMDFGLARRPSLAGPNPSHEPLIGTPTYMAPELWKGVKPSVTSDIYALGVVLWELVSARRPADLGVTSATLDWDERPAWKPPHGFGKWDRILACCLDADPARRFQSADQAAAALGPSLRRRGLLTAAAAVVLAIASGLITYQRATVPPETVRLALLPFSSEPGESALPTVLFRDTASRLARVGSNLKTKFIFIPKDRIQRLRVDTLDKARVLLGATHVLRGVLDRRSTDTVKVRGYLTEVPSGIDVMEWDADYKPEEIRYAPAALVGMVTASLHLTPPEVPAVNAAAHADYIAGLSDVRRDSTVDAALRHFARAVAADPDSPLTYAALAEAQWFKYFTTDDKAWMDRAAQSVRQAERRNPDLPEVHRIAGLLKKNSGWYDQAAAEYQRSIELDPANGDAFRRLGEAYESNNQLEPAKAAFLKAVALDPRQYRNYQDLGFYYMQRASYEEAASYFRQAVTLAPSEPLIHYILSTALSNSGQLAAAEDELRRSIRLQETPKALHALGVVLLMQGKDREAIAPISKALQMSPEQYLWWMNLGTAYRRAGRRPDSKSAYRRGLALAEAEMTRNPRSGKVRAYLAYLAAQLGDTQRSKTEIAQALAQSPNDADTLWAAATTYEALGRRDDALAVLAASPAGVLQDLSRWPDVADLCKDSRFLQLLPHSEK